MQIPYVRVPPVPNYWMVCMVLAPLSVSGCAPRSAPEETAAPISEPAKPALQPSQSARQQRQSLDPVAKLVVDSLQSSESFELLSLQPGVQPGETLDKYDFQFHGWPLLGKIDVTHPQTRDKILAAVEKMVDADGVGAPCFTPRHGLRLEDKDGVLDVVVCFECGWMRVYRGEIEVGGARISGGQIEFDQVLKQYNISLPDRKTIFHDPQPVPAPPPAEELESQIPKI